MKVVPDTPVDIGFTALFTAAQFGLRDTVSVLVKLGADPHRLNCLTHLHQNNNYFVSGNVQSYLHLRLIINTTNKLFSDFLSPFALFNMFCLDIFSSDIDAEIISALFKPHCFFHNTNSVLYYLGFSKHLLIKFTK